MVLERASIYLKTGELSNLECALADECAPENQQSVVN